jgi:hypothetical protein
MPTPENAPPVDRVTAITGLVAVVLPSVVSLVKALSAKSAPDQPVPTDAEVLMAFDSVVIKSLAVDDAWLSAHPQNG